MNKKEKPANSVLLVFEELAMIEFYHDGKDCKNEFSFWIEILRQELVQQQMIPMRSEIILSSMIWTGKLLLNKE